MKKNKKLILIYLIPVKMLLGRIQIIERDPPDKKDNVRSTTIPLLDTFI